jgi:hypothetical protein
MSSFSLQWYSENDFSSIIMFCINQCLGAYLGLIASIYYEQPKAYVMGYTIAGALGSICFALWQLFAGLILSALAFYINPELAKLFARLTPILIETFVVCFIPVSFLLGAYYTVLLYKKHVN